LNLTVTVDPMTVGSKTGELRITSNDADENPFIIPLTAQITPVGQAGAPLLLNDAAGAIFEYNPANGTTQTLATGLTPMTDIAQHPTQNTLYGVDATHIYSIVPATSTTTRLFAHGMINPTALAFDSSGNLFAAGQQIYSVNLTTNSSSIFSNLGSQQAGDIAFANGNMYITTESGSLFRVSPPAPTLLGNLNNLSLRGLANLNNTMLVGFANNQAYLIDVTNVTATPSYTVPTNGVNGATVKNTSTGRDAHNEAEPLDVDNNSAIIPLDALLVINELNTPTFINPTTGQIIADPPASLPFPDVNNDGFVTPVDAILIINRLNNPLPVAAVPATPSDEWVDAISPRDWLLAAAALDGWDALKKPAGASAGTR
jgi:hypothetical protein